MTGRVTCPACGHESSRTYRCSECGKDLVGDETTTDDGADAPEDQAADAWDRLDAAEVIADD